MTGDRPLVIAVSGWRWHTGAAFINFIMMQQVRLLRPGQRLFVRVGDARGADALVRAWCEQTKALNPHYFHNFDVYYADWDRLGHAAGPLRSIAMLKGDQDPWGLADKLIGFPQPGVHNPKDSGTWTCVKKAFSLGIPVDIPSTDRRAYERR